MGYKETAMAAKKKSSKVTRKSVKSGAPRVGKKGAKKRSAKKSV